MQPDIQSWLRLAGQHVPAIYGPSGDVKSAADDPTYSIAAASRAAPEPYNDQRPTTNDQRPTTNDQRPTTND